MVDESGTDHGLVGSTGPISFIDDWDLQHMAGFSTQAIIDYGFGHADYLFVIGWISR